jgi:hypothetical protein
MNFSLHIHEQENAISRTTHEQVAPKITFSNAIEAALSDSENVCVYLGRFGEQSDLEELEHGYESALTHVDPADRVAAVKRLEKSRRNAFYARVANDGLLVSRAVKVSKSDR